MVVWVWVWAIFPLVERRSKIKVGREEEEEEGGCAVSLSVLVARMSAPGLSIAGERALSSLAGS